MGDETIKNYIISGDFEGLKDELEHRKANNQALKLNIAYDNKILPLNYAILYDQYEIVELLLEMGANPNGKCDIGVPKTVPMCETLYSLQNGQYELKNVDFILLYIQLLQKYGGDINDYGLDLLPVIGWFWNSFSKNIEDNNLYKSYLILLEILLKRGSDPNLQICPAIFRLCLLINVKIDIIMNNKPLQKTILDMFKILLYFNAKNNIVMYTGLTAKDMLKEPRGKDPDFVYKIENLIFTPLQQFLDDCAEPLIIKKLANIFKIPYNEEDFNFDENDSDEEVQEKMNRLKQICECIRKIKQYKKYLDFDEIKELRKTKNGIVCSNEMTLIGPDPNEFDKKYLFVVKSGDVPYCYHVNELLSLIQQKKNIWAQKDLTDDEIFEITNFFEGVIPNTDNELEAFEDSFEEQDLQHFTLNDLLGVLEKFIKSFNTYVQTEAFLNFNGFLLDWLKKKIELGVGGFININILKNISKEYIQLKIYQFVLYLIESVKDKYHLTTLYTLNIEPALLLQEMRKTIFEYMMDKDVDLSFEYNNSIIKKTNIKKLAGTKIRNINGFYIPFEEEWVDEILDIIGDKGKQSLFEIITPDFDWRIKLWNETLGYAFDKY